jgi:chromosome segregation ATPase
MMPKSKSKKRSGNRKSQRQLAQRPGGGGAAPTKQAAPEILLDFIPATIINPAEQALELIEKADSTTMPPEEKKLLIINTTTALSETGRMFLPSGAEQTKQILHNFHECNRLATTVAPKAGSIKASSSGKSIPYNQFLNDLITNMKQTVGHLKPHMNAFKATLSAHQQKQANLHAQLLEQQQAYETANSLNLNYLAKCKALNTELASEKEQNAQLIAERKTQQAAMLASKAANQQKLKQLNTELATTRGRISELETALAQAEQKLKKTTVTTRQQTKALQKSSKERKAALTRTNQLERQYKTSIAALKADIGELKQQSNTKDTTHQQEKTHLEEELASQAATHKAQVTALQAELAQLRQAAAQAASAPTPAVERRTTAEHREAQAVGELRAVSEMNGRLKTELEYLQQGYAGLYWQHQQLDQAYRALQQAHQMTLAQNAQLRTTIQQQKPNPMTTRSRGAGKGSNRPRLQARHGRGRSGTAHGQGRQGQGQRPQHLGQAPRHFGQ